MSENPAAHCPQKLGHIYEYLDGALSCQELQGWTSIFKAVPSALVNTTSNA